MFSQRCTHTRGSLPQRCPYTFQMAIHVNTKQLGTCSTANRNRANKLFEDVYLVPHRPLSALNHIQHVVCITHLQIQPVYRFSVQLNYSLPLITLSRIPKINNCDKESLRWARVQVTYLLRTVLVSQVGGVTSRVTHPHSRGLGRGKCCSQSLISVIPS